jgi:hypothetical protein
MELTGTVMAMREGGVMNVNMHAVVPIRRDKSISVVVSWLYLASGTISVQELLQKK